MEGTKYDTGKRIWSLLPWEPLGLVVDVLMSGAKKYSPNNWMKVNPPERYLDAAMRHLVARLQGEVLDKESGLPHLAHLTCCALFSLWFDHFNKGEPHEKGN